jgi:hypothetical protein
MSRFGLTTAEVRFLRGLRPVWRIQAFLDEIDYDVDGTHCRSPRRVMRERSAQCLDGALLAAAALRVQGHPPLLLDLEAVRDDDHVLALFKRDGCWGAIAKSNYSGLRFREPIFRNLRELALSYFEVYFNLEGEKSLRRYSMPLDLSRFDDRAWMTADDTEAVIAMQLVRQRHFAVLTPGMKRQLARVDSRSFASGLLGRRPGPG